MTTLEKLRNLIQEALEKSEFTVSDFLVEVEYPKDKNHGDYATNIAMKLSKKLGKNPREIASVLIDEIQKTTYYSTLIEGVSIAGPGFINIKISKKELQKTIEKAVDQGADFGSTDFLAGQKILLEFACPNTHKAFHIGHLRNICLGESLVRFLESQGADVFRANYQGDVGPHVAKCIWGIMNTPRDLEFLENEMQPLHSVEEALEFEKNILTTPHKKVEYLGKVYAFGSKKYEKDDNIKSEIKEINKCIYAKDQNIIPLWEVTRQWSLDYFEYIYKRLGSSFNGYFFESQMYELGKQIVLNHIEDGIYEKSDCAIVFRGENYGLHTRVFITSEGNTTYEGKEMANIITERKAYDFDKKIHIVANEQSGYFKVIFKVSGLIDPTLVEKQYHVDYGMVNLTSGKMSSRTGDVITADSLLDDAKGKIQIVLEKSDLTDNEKEKVAEKVAVGAVKFTMLHADAKRDIAFNLEQSLKLTGDSGPYLQYGYTRITSILRKIESTVKADYNEFNEDDWVLAKQILRFSEEVSKSAKEFTTHNTAHYLIDVVSEFSRWYEKNRVAGSNEGLKSARLQLLKAIKQVLENGLYLLGIEVVEKM